MTCDGKNHSQGTRHWIDRESWRNFTGVIYVCHHLYCIPFRKSNLWWFICMRVYYLFFKALVVILSASWWVYFISLIITSYRPYPYGKATPFLRECQHSNAFAELVYYLVQILYGIRAFWWPSYLNSCQRSSSDVHCWHSLNRIQIWGDGFIFRKLGTC